MADQTQDRTGGGVLVTWLVHTTWGWLLGFVMVVVVAVAWDMIGDRRGSRVDP